MNDIYDQEGLEESLTVRNFRTVRQEGKRQVICNLTYYKLDAIISIGFRVNSKRGILFFSIFASKIKDTTSFEYFSKKLSNFSPYL